MSVMKRQSGALLLLFVFLQIIVNMVEAKVHYHDFVITEKNFTISCVTRSLVVVNKQFPGPTLYVNKGDTAFIKVQNDANARITLHWHGVIQPRNPWSDGPVYITQCPIEPSENFTYKVIFSLEEGTLWWHAHNEWMRNTVHGAIVIYPAEGSTRPYPVPFGEQVLILGSWYNFDVNLAVEEQLKNGGDMPISSHLLINGLPGDFSGCSSEEETFRWRVDHNKTYLLRIVGATMNADMFFAVAKHNLTVVGTDGHYLKPFETSYIMISAGQTIDVLVTTNQSSPTGKYYIVAKQFLSGETTDYTYDSTKATAIIEYSGEEDEDEDDDIVVIFPDTLPLHNDSVAAYRFIERFKSLVSEAYPTNVPMNITTHMFVTVSMMWLPYKKGANCSRCAGSGVNNISSINTETDILQAYYRNMSGIYTEDFPDQPEYYYNFTGNTGNITDVGMTATKVKMLNYNEQVEIVIQGTDLNYTAEDHPMHLHGHSFYRVGFGFGNFDPQNDPMSYNLINPPLVNTFTVPTNGWIAIRFKTNNPGVWLWHCHMDRHLSWGMNTVFITKNGGTPESSMIDPPSNMPSCKSSSPIFGAHDPQFDKSI